MHTKSRYSEHRLKSEKLSAEHQEKGQRGVNDGMGLFWGRKRVTFCPFVVKSVNTSVYLKFLWYLVLPACSTLTTPSATLYFSRIMLQCILHQLLPNGLSSTISRWMNALPTCRTLIPSNMSG